MWRLRYWRGQLAAHIDDWNWVVVRRIPLFSWWILCDLNINKIDSVHRFFSQMGSHQLSAIEFTYCQGLLAVHDSYTFVLSFLFSLRVIVYTFSIATD